MKTGNPVVKLWIALECLRHSGDDGDGGEVFFDKSKNFPYCSCRRSQLDGIFLNNFFIIKSRYSYMTNKKQAEGGILGSTRQEINAPALMRHKFSPRYGLNETDIGELIQTDNVCRGILLAPKFRHVSEAGREIGPEFVYFTAEKDTRYLASDGFSSLPTTCYDTEIHRIEALDVYGHRGFSPDIHDAVRNYPEILARWHMPVQALVNGHDAGHNKYNPYNLYRYRNINKLAGSFQEAVWYDRSNFYFTASPHEYSDDSVGVRTVDFRDGSTCDSYRYPYSASSRPVRAEVLPA